MSRGHVVSVNTPRHWCLRLCRPRLTVPGAARTGFLSGFSATLASGASDPPPGAQTRAHGTRRPGTRDQRPTAVNTGCDAPAPGVRLYGHSPRRPRPLLPIALVPDSGLPYLGAHAPGVGSWCPCAPSAGWLIAGQKHQGPRERNRPKGASADIIGYLAALTSWRQRRLRGDRTRRERVRLYASLTAYPNNPAARKAIKPQAKCTNAR
jgi:hypothetical protein